MKKIYTIGRDEGCDIVIPDSTDVISRLHATIRVESKNKIFLIDQSRNGTYVNGMKMSSNVEIPISREDVVSFAHIYNLDWSLVPKPRTNLWAIALFSLLGIALVTGIVYGGVALKNRPAKMENIIDAPESPAPIPVDEDTAVQDTVVVHDTVKVEKEVPQEKVEDGRKDSVKVEKPKEEIYDPIY